MINTFYLTIIILTMIVLSAYLLNWQRNSIRVVPTPFIETVETSTAERDIKINPNVGCQFPYLDPFSKDAMKYERNISKIHCRGEDWVKCNISGCGVSKHILDTFKNVVCYYQDIIYITDRKYELGNKVTRYGSSFYNFNRSDGLKISCKGYRKAWYRIFPWIWYGYKVGLRPINAKISDEKTINILMVAFDSASHHAFIRKMPKSYKYLEEELGAVILNGYNIVGDGTSEALFPLLSGKSELQHPPARKQYSKLVYLDPELFIFHKAKINGYETAYLEDMPWVGTFQYRHNGFLHQPADHYLRSFFIEYYKNKVINVDRGKYCLGEIPQYLYLLNLARQFMSLKTKRFCLTFIADISHDNIHLISTADDDLVDFLKYVKLNLLEDTMVIVMGDHGPRYSAMRKIHQGRIEERMPLMSIILPERLKRERPDALKFLKLNADVLTTPFDIHTTLLDAMGLREHASDFVEPNSNMRRGLSLLEPISVLRSCSDAGVLPFWCVCMNVRWKAVAKDDPKFRAVGNALVLYINKKIFDIRELCFKRKLISTEWVIMNESEDPKTGKTIRSYQTLIITNPGHGVFEALMQYDSENGFVINSDNEVSRISAYGKEPACVSATHPHLNKYCYCRKK